MPKLLSNLNVGDSAEIADITHVTLRLKLEEMACLIGENISVLHKAPFKGPIAIRVSGYTLSLRHEEAQSILLR